MLGIVQRIAIFVLLVLPGLLIAGCGKKEEKAPVVRATSVVEKVGATNVNGVAGLMDVVGEVTNIQVGAPVLPGKRRTALTNVQARAAEQTREAPVPPKAREFPGQDVYEKGLAELGKVSDREAGERALKFFREAAELGNAPAQHAMGVSYLAGIGVEKDLAQGLIWLNKSAAQGYAEAEFKLASLYIRGDVVPEDAEKAVEFARRAADQGHAEAQYNLGTMYATGKGVTKDLRAAADWFRKAAAAGHATAQSNLGVLYASGEVLEKNLEEAIGWWRKAAEQGQPSAQFNLAQALVEGKAVPKDLVEAYKWYHLAAERGDRDAGRMRNAVGVELSPEEVAEGLKRAREFKSKLQAEVREKMEKREAVF